MDAVGHLEHVRHVVADQDDPEALVTKVLDELEHLSGLADTECRRRFVEDHNLATEHSVAMVGFDDLAMAEALDPAITVVDQDAAALGRTAAERLFARLDGDTSPPAVYRLPTRLIVRGSGEIAALRRAASS